MTPAEAAVLLAKISANDNREVTEAGARAWAEALPDVAVEDAIAYLPQFYREATRDGKNWIYPGDVLAGVVEIHRRNRAEISIRTHREYLEQHGDDMDVELQALVAMKEAAAEYDRTHAIPNVAEPRKPGPLDSARFRGIGAVS